MRQVLGEYETIASDTYQRLQQAQPGLLTENREQFMTNYTQRISAQIPSPDRIREKFDFKYLLIDGLSQVGNSPTEQTNETTERLSTTIDAARSEVQQREWQRSVLEHDLRLHAQERVNAVLDDFLTTIVSQLRSFTYEATCDVLSTLQRRSNESISPRSIVQLNNLLAQVRSLNFYGDADIDRIMTQIEQIVQQTPADRQASITDIQRTLRAIATVTRSTLLDLDEELRSARDMGVPDFPTDSVVRQARAEIRARQQGHHNKERTPTPPTQSMQQGADQRAYITSQQCDLIQVLCERLGESEPEYATLTEEAADLLITHLRQSEDELLLAADDARLQEVQPNSDPPQTEMHVGREAVGTLKEAWLHAFQISGTKAMKRVAWATFKQEACHAEVDDDAMLTTQHELLLAAIVAEKERHQTALVSAAPSTKTSQANGQAH